VWVWVVVVVVVVVVVHRLWALEDENRELANKLEFSRENVKVLKRGYAEKIDDMQRKLGVLSA
jgi:DNA-binding Xre family transcriptional regulator